MSAVLGTLARDVLTKGLKPNMMLPKKPPEGLYDTFKPGDLIYCTGNFLGNTRGHYGVYVGKRQGVHTVFDVGESTSTAKMRPLDNTTKNGWSSWGKAQRVRKNRHRQPSSEQLMKIIAQLENKRFSWTGYKQNCESFARAIVNDLPVSLQGREVTDLTADILERLFTLSPDLSKPEITTASIRSTVRRTLAETKTDGPSTAYYRSHPEAAAKKVRHQAEINRRPEERKRRAALNKERRRRGIDGKGGPDVSHTVAGKTVLEDPSTNRARNGHGSRPRLKQDSVWAEGFHPFNP